MIDNLIRSATCKVSCGNESGTGYLIGHSAVLTARHCVLEAIDSNTVIDLIFENSNGENRFTGTIAAESTDFDVCILSIPTVSNRQPLPIATVLPREGIGWRSFGYPIGKRMIGHRISGQVAHILDYPKLKMDIDLAVDANIALQKYQGFSGAAVVCENVSIGLIRLKVDGTIGAISIHQLSNFLNENGIQLLQPSVEEDSSIGQHARLVDRSVFQETLEELIVQNQGEYIFLEGAHGIGKTTFCREFTARNKNILNLGVYILGSQERGESTAYRAQPEVFFEWLLTSISMLLSGKPSRKEDRSYTKLISDTTEMLELFSNHCMSTNVNGVIFIDGVNEILSITNAAEKLIGLLPLKLPKNISVIISSTNYSQVAIVLASRVRDRHRISLPRLDDQDIEAYCLHEINKDILTQDLVKVISKKAQGHPLYLRYLIEYANTNHGILDDFPILSGYIEEYYESLWPTLQDDIDALNMVAIMARLRWGIKRLEFLKILSIAEQKIFIPTFRRVQHLLLDPETTTIYHKSFSDFLITKTADLEGLVQNKLADFCIKETNLEYCTLNLVYHLVRGDEKHQALAVNACGQSWVDSCVLQGVEPDTLLLDIETTLDTAITIGPAVEVVRILLLHQRVNFRYNTLFAQSAKMITEALIALKRPREALKHSIRFNHLIINPHEVLDIAYLLVKNGYNDEALELLDLQHNVIVDIYRRRLNELHIGEFFTISCAHLRTVLFMRLAENGGRMKQIVRILYNTEKILRYNLSAEPGALKECISKLKSLPASYFICFHDTYADLDTLKKQHPEAKFSSETLLLLIMALFECENFFEIYNIPIGGASLSQFFLDIEQLFKHNLNSHNYQIVEVVDRLIRFGANSSLVKTFADTFDVITPSDFNIKMENGVDFDYQIIDNDLKLIRIVAFLSDDLDCPAVGKFSPQGWVSNLKKLFLALYWCDGKARRAKADGNEILQKDTLELLNKNIVSILDFTLSDRAKWENSYSIPEGAFPCIYEQITIILIDCYLGEIQFFLKKLSEISSYQCGLYTEGFRKVMNVIFRKLTAICAFRT